MKKLLILIDKPGPKKTYLFEFVKKTMPEGTEVQMACFPDLVYKIVGDKIEVKITPGGADIKDFDLVYIRRAGARHADDAANLALYLHSQGIKFMDTTHKNIGSRGSKFTSYLKLAMAGLPVIPSFFCYQSQVKNYKETIVQELGLPVVAKEIFMQRGKGVLLIKTMEDFDELHKKFPEGREYEFMFQKFIKSDEEYRILVLGSSVGSYLRRHITTEGEFRANAALGAREEFMDPANINSEMKDISVNAAKAMELQVAGVDVFLDENKKMWLIEINRGPGLTEESQEYTSLANYLRDTLMKND